MEDKPFNEPRLALNRIYTKVGDRGETNLVGGQKVPKDALRIECYGTVDELISHTGAAIVTASETAQHKPELYRLMEALERVQHELFNLGAILATLSADVHPKQARVTEGEVTHLETEIDEFNDQLPPLRSFILPGGSRLNTDLHVCRTVCRRAERLAVRLAREEDVDQVNVRYLNRLSDAYFVWSRWANKVLGCEEVLWEPNRASSARANSK